jgi:integration host factor subunit beta
LTFTYTFGTSYSALPHLATGQHFMIKSELVKRIALQNSHLREHDVEKIVNAILNGIVTALASGNRVELRGFGAFSVRHRPSRAGRNPRTGAKVNVDAKKMPFFKSGKGMQERLNRGETAMSAELPIPKTQSASGL